MRRFLIFFLLLLFFIPYVGAQSTGEVRITEEFTDQNLKEILSILNTKYGIKFAYDDELIEDISVNLLLEDKTPEQAIALLLAATSLDFRIIDETIMIFPSEKENTVVSRVNVNALVMDMNTGEPLPFANILINSSNLTVASNADGRFNIPELPETATLKVYYLGYRPKEIQVSELMANGFKVGMSNEVEELDEVVVTADRSEILQISDGISQISFNPKKMSSLPNLGELDVFRTMQLLPGIGGTNETSSGLAVRGSSPDQNLILFDGFTLYHIDHFYGVYSAFNSNAIQNIQLYKGGFDAKYGGRASSVIDITGKTGGTQPSVGFGINLIGANAVAEIPIGKKVRVLAAFRRSYTDVIQSDLYKDLFDNVFSSSLDARTQDIPQFEDIEPVFYFYDLNTKVSYQPSDKDVISFSLYNSKDNLRLESNEFLTDFVFSEVAEDTQWGNTGGSLRWGRQWNSRYYSNLYVAHSNYFSDTRIRQSLGLINSDTLISFVLEQNNDVNDLTLKLDNEYIFSPQSILQFGLLFNANQVDLSTTFGDQTAELLDQDGEQTAFYLQHIWKPMERLEIDVGLRSNYFDLLDENYLEPRASIQYKFNDQFLIKGAAGLNHQFINRIVRQELFQSNPDFWILSDDIPEVESRQFVGGFQFENNGFIFDVEAYYKFSDGIIEYIPRLSNFQQATQVSFNLYRIGENTTKGIDFLLEKKTGKYTGWIAYTLSKSENTFDGLNRNEPFPSRLDQRHELKLVNMLSLGKWDLALNWVYGSGKPYSAPSGTYTLTFLDSARQEYAAIDSFNDQRLPEYHRLDFSATYNFKIGKGNAEAGLSIFNVYGRENIKFRRFTRVYFDEETQELLQVPEFIVNDVKLLGFTPNIFFRYNL